MVAMVRLLSFDSRAPGLNPGNVLDVYIHLRAYLITVGLLLTNRFMLWNERKNNNKKRDALSILFAKE